VLGDERCCTDSRARQLHQELDGGDDIYLGHLAFRVSQNA
jgi:hypothetical protein